MDYSLVLLLAIIIAQVQGLSYSGLNQTSRYQQNSVDSDSNRQKQFRSKEFDKVFQHYRSDAPRREPRFISFQTKDDNIEVEIDFAIPFLSIPVKRSLSGAMGTFQNVISGIPMANINMGAILLTGFVVVGGAMIGGISRLLSGGNFIEIAGAMPWFRSGQKKQKNVDSDSSFGIEWWRILDQIDKALVKYGIDTTACTQRVICWHVKDSVANIQDKKASNFDHVISGVASSEWALQLIPSSAWNEAAIAGRKGQNCEATYSHCQLSPNKLESFTSKLVKYATNRN